MKRYLKESLSLLGDDRTKLPILILFFLLASLLDLVGLALVGPYVTLVMDSGVLNDGALYGLLTSINVSTKPNDVLVILGLVLLCVFVLKAGSAIWVNRVIIRFCLQQRAKLRSQLMHSYQGLPYTTYLRRNSSEYVHAIQILTRQYTDGVLQAFLRLISEGIIAAVILIYLAWNNTIATGLFLLLLGASIFFYDRIYRKKIAKYGEQSNKYAICMVQAVNEGIEGMKEIRILNKEYYFYKVVRDESEKCSEAFMKSQFITTVPRYLFELILVSFVVFLVLSMLISGQDLSILAATLAVFGVAALRLLPAANILINGMSQLRFSRHSTRLLYEDLKCAGKITHNKIANKISKGNNFKLLRLENVSFSYPGSNRRALKNISLSIKSGESIGLIGASGSGKTTLVDVMLGLLEPQSGVIEFNGECLRNSIAQWRSNVAYLPQQIFLVDNTLRCNVALGEEDIDDSRVMSALRKASLIEMVDQLSEGVNTVLGERGVRLSGGQRQRVALARAFYHGRNVLVMDEATSALDNEVEKEIVEEINQLKGDKTMIVIAHRLTTVQHCDRIYRLENGEIVEQGKFDEVVSGT